MEPTTGKSWYQQCRSAVGWIFRVKAWARFKVAKQMEDYIIFDYSIEKKQFRRSITWVGWFFLSPGSSFSHCSKCCCCFKLHWNTLCLRNDDVRSISKDYFKKHNLLSTLFDNPAADGRRPIFWALFFGMCLAGVIMIWSFSIIFRQERFDETIP